MAARRQVASNGLALPHGLATEVEAAIDGIVEVPEFPPNGTQFQTLEQIQREMARSYWQGLKGKITWPEVFIRSRVLKEMKDTIVAARALRVAERASEHAPLVGVQIVAPESKMITSEDKE